jgi:cytochrome c-type biogenesis protein CcmH/NrfG
MHAEDWSLAEQQVTRSLELKPGWTEALILQAQVSLKQDQGSKARAQLEAALQREPDNMELQLAYARLLVDLKISRVRATSTAACSSVSLIMDRLYIRWRCSRWKPVI